MDKLKVKSRSARNKLAESVSQGTGSGSLAVPPSTLHHAHDNSSTTGVNEGFPGTAARDFAAADHDDVVQPTLEPPTSLQSSVDAGNKVALPPSVANPVTPQRRRSNSAPTRRMYQLGASPQQRDSPSSHRGSPLPHGSPQQGSMQRRPPVGVRQASIGIRRMPSSVALNHNVNTPNASTQRLSHPLQALDEGAETNFAAPNSSESTLGQPEQPSRLRKAKSAVQNRIPFWGSPAPKPSEKTLEPRGTAVPQPDQHMDYSSNMVDVLDTIDPEVATLTSLTNLQNSLFIPNLPFFNRRPTYNIHRSPSEAGTLADIYRAQGTAQNQSHDQLPPSTLPRIQRTETGATTTTMNTIDSQLSDSRYAVLPDGTSLEGWSKEDKAEVNDHVRHMLHSKRSKFKRTMRGFGQYVRRPLGFLVTLYAFLITIFGLAWVLFLIGWINVGGQQIYVVHIIDSVLVALFAVVGDGLAPFRAIDTYHMIYIAHYHHFTWSRRKKDMLPALSDPNDLPAHNAPIASPRADDPEQPHHQNWEFTVLTPKQQAKLEHHQTKFSKSHSFYKPHETETHTAFPLRLLVAIVVLLDCHSLLQISLGATTWGIYYKHRPMAITTVILCCSITVNAVAGLLIWVGDKRTRKTDVLERMNRQELTEEAMRIVEERKKEGSQSEGEGGEKKREGRLSLDVLRRPKAGEPTAENAYP